MGWKNAQALDGAFPGASGMDPAAAEGSAQGSSRTLPSTGSVTSKSKYCLSDSLFCLVAWTMHL